MKKLKTILFYFPTPQTPQTSFKQPLPKKLIQQIFTLIILRKVLSERLISKSVAKVESVWIQIRLLSLVMPI